jgi:hypothetical protein
MKLKRPVGPIETRRLVYCKYLFLQGKRYLENKDVESYFNISVILFANAIEIFVQTLAFCAQGRDRSNDKVSDVLKSLARLQDFSYSEFDKAIKARNAIYHSAVLHTFNSCKDIEETSERSLKFAFRSYLDVSYDDVSLTDLVSDDKVRVQTKEAEQFLLAGNYVESVISSCHAFAMLEHRIKERGRYQVSDKRSDLFSNTEISWTKELKRFLSKIESPQALIPFSRHIEEKVNKKIINLARHFDFLLMLGSGYEDYKHFESIRPVYLVFIDGKFECIRESAEKMNYSKDQAEFIFNFVLRTVLEIEPRLKPIDVRDLSKKIVRTVK